MARITREGLEACMAFGAASLAVADIAELVADQLPAGEVRELLEELDGAHNRLRELFADGEDAKMHRQALSILALADRAAAALGHGRLPPGQ